MDPILIPTWITTILLSWQVNSGMQHNAKYTFIIDNDQSIVIMNTQTGDMQRCSKDFICEPFKKKE